MVDISLIVIAVVVPCVLCFANVVVLAKYIDPEAAAGHYTAKLMLLLGLLLAEGTILLLPLDVGNNAGVTGCGVWNNNCGGLDIILVWQIVYCMIFGLIVVVFPFFIFYYEASDEGMSAEEESGGSFFARLCSFKDMKRSLLSACCYTLITVVICALIVGLSYRYAAFTSMPYRLTSVVTTSVAFQPISLPIMPAGTTVCPGGANTCLLVCGTGNCDIQLTYIQMAVSFIIYLASLMTFVGWFIFSIYCGIGFVALPIDCIMSFVHRPKVLSVAEARAQKKVLMNRSSELLKIADAMASGIIDFTDDVHTRSERRKRQKIDRGEMNRFRVLVDMLEKDLETFQLSDPAEYRKHYNPLVPFAKLIAGIIAILMSTVWILQIILFMITAVPLDPFMNTYLLWFDQWFPAFGTITVAIFGLYLLLAAAAGNFKFGTRFFLIKVHPMEVGKTLMNSFMFNIALILLCVLPATQFMLQAFSIYARLSDADVIGQQMKYMQGMTYFYRFNIFIFMLLGFTILAAIYFAIWPSDRDQLNKVMMQIKQSKLKERKGLERKIQQKGGALSQVELGNAKNWK